LGLSMTTMSNTGIIPTELGSFSNLGQLPAGTKIIAACSMLMGRLECFTLLALCFPSFWRKTKW
ncbi:MAG: TrkH family potassium uptake protein, partial [Dialister sp.]|nr:TrkH family potassium uptake protein [Dialister sp.]